MSPADQLTWYVRRECWKECENGSRVSTCYHQPRCGPLRADQPVGERPFGRIVTGWTRVRGSVQAEREAAAWESVGWTTRIEKSTRQIRAEVRAWENRTTR